MPTVGDGTSGSEDDPLQQARAYNHSIYMMVAMPYVLLGGVGFLIYRGVRKNQLYRQAAAAPTVAEGFPCPPPSTDVNSWPPA